MPSNDPTDNGGLFIGRRPGTAPLRFRGTPVAGDGLRQRADIGLAAALLVFETLLLVTLWGPQPAAWLWTGSHVFHETGSVTAGIVVAFLGMFLTIFASIALAMRLDRAWILVRRSAGHEQRKGMLERIFVVSVVVAGSAFLVWFTIHAGAAIDAPRGSH